MVQSVSSQTGEAEAIQTKHHFYHDMEGEGSLSTTIASALAEVRQVDVMSLGFALYDYIDADALDALFAPKTDGTLREGSSLEFVLLDHRITVFSEGHIVITSLTDEPGPE